MKKLLLTLLTAVMSITAWAVEPRVSLDFTNANRDWKDANDNGMSSSYVSNEARTYSNGPYSIEIMGQPSASNGFKAQSGYVILGKKDAYIKLPTMSFSVKRIVVGGRTGASSAVTFNIFVGENAASTAVTGCTTNQTFDIKDGYQNSGNEYTIKVTNANFLQVTKVDFYDEIPAAVPVSSVSLDKTAVSMYAGGMKETLTATVLPANADDLSLTWTSSDANVVTVDGGVLTSVAAGTATITATSNADGDKKATCQVTVTNPAATGFIYEKITTNLANWEGKYLLVYEDENRAFDGSLGTGMDVAYNTIPVNRDNSVISSTTLTDAAVFTFAKVDGGYLISSNDGTHIGVGSYSNGLKANSTEYVNNIVYNSTENRAEISITFAGGTMYLNFNKNSSDKRFRYYKDHSNQAIQLYKLLAFDATISTSGLTTVCLPYDAELNDAAKTAGAQAWKMTNISNEGVITLEQVDALKANEGFILQGEPSSTVTLVKCDAPVYTDNLLNGVTERTARTSLDLLGEDGFAFPWILNKENKFVKYTGDYLPANKAYLDGGWIDVAGLSLNAASLRLNFEGMEDGYQTAISLTPSLSEGEGACYDLFGRRANGKGLMIQNGKVVLVK